MKPLLRHTANAEPIAKPKVLQFGGGNFLRAFLDWMLEEMNRNAGFNGGAILVKPTPGGDYQTLRKQEGLFHLCLRGMSGGKVVDDIQLIRSISQVIHPYQEYDRYLESALIPELRVIVSNTTEAGIAYRAEDNRSDTPALSFPGKLTQWLHHRFTKFEGSPESGCYILPCELLESNGEKLKEIVLRYAEDWDMDPGFIFWLNRHNHFCNTLVDRIVTGFPDTEAGNIQESIGYADECLVVAEPYHLWAIEDSGDLQKLLPAPQAGLNVKFTDNLAAYRDLKVGILNGAHTSMVPVGLLAGVTTVGAFMGRSDLENWIKALLTEEVAPCLPGDAQEARDYVESTLDRFRNPFMRHKLADIALNTAAKVETRILPSLRRYFERNGTIAPRLALALAAMLRFYKDGGKDTGLPVRDTETALDHFRKAWQAPSPASRVAQALDFWPSLPPDMRPPLEKTLQGILEELEAEGIGSLVRKSA